MRVHSVCPQRSHVTYLSTTASVIQRPTPHVYVNPMLSRFAARLLGLPAPRRRLPRRLRLRNRLEEFVRWPDELRVARRDGGFVDVEKYDQSKLPQRAENDEYRRWYLKEWKQVRF